MEQMITMTIEELERLLAIEDGDAALVFLAAKRGREPAIGETRLFAARKKLAGAGMIPSSFADRPSYSQSEIAHSKLTNPAFRNVVDETERILGKALSPSDLQTLHSIHKWRGLSPDALFLLLHYCEKEQSSRSKPLTMRAIDREAEVWEREGIWEEEAAEIYIQKKDASREASSKVFYKLGIFGREPSPTEKKFVAEWLGLGFTVEAIAVAYDKTVINTGGLNWRYCNKILRNWHEKGWRTPEQIEAGDHKKSTAAAERGGGTSGSVDRARQILEQVMGEDKDAN
jgi:DnaD/phage-associated family protein